jgi:hypothetical protein
MPSTPFYMWATVLLWGVVAATVCDYRREFFIKSVCQRLPKSVFTGPYTVAQRPALRATLDLKKRGAFLL